MDTECNFSSLQIICQIVCKAENFCTAPKDLGLSFSATVLFCRSVKRADQIARIILLTVSIKPLPQIF